VESLDATGFSEGGSLAGRHSGDKGYKAGPKKQGRKAVAPPRQKEELHRLKTNERGKAGRRKDKKEKGEGGEGFSALELGSILLHAGISLIDHRGRKSREQAPEKGRNRCASGRGR